MYERGERAREISRNHDYQCRVEFAVRGVCVGGSNYRCLREHARSRHAKIVASLSEITRLTGKFSRGRVWTGDDVVECMQITSMRPRDKGEYDIPLAAEAKPAPPVPSFSENMHVLGDNVIRVRPRN